MRKFICMVCGYIYDEAAGDPDSGIAPGTKWEDVPENWICPVCGASKADFEEEKAGPSADDTAGPGGAGDRTADAIPGGVENRTAEPDDLRELSFGEISALCSNLAKGCEKQYRPEEAEWFGQLAEFYRSKSRPEGESRMENIGSQIGEDLAARYPQASAAASGVSDRGALRALVWSEKVTKILLSLLDRYEKQQDALLENTRIYVCDICGFVYIGDELPAVCPVCKVPNRKISEIKRR